MSRLRLLLTDAILRCAAHLFAAVVVYTLAFAAFAQETAPEATEKTEAETTYFDLGRSEDRTTRMIAERYFSLVKLQEWIDSTGKSRVVAKYLEHDPDLAWVKLQAVRGRGAARTVKEITVPVDKLSKTCQSRVRQIDTLQKKLDELLAKAGETDAAGETGSAPGDHGQPMVDERGVEPRSAGPEHQNLNHSREFESPARSPAAEDDPASAEFDPDPLGFAEIAMSPPPSSTGAEIIPGPGARPNEFRHPTTPEELIFAFTEAFNAGDHESLEKLIYWGDSTPDHHKITRSSLIDKAGTAKLIRVDLKVLPTEEAPDKDYTIKSNDMLDIEYESSTSNITFSWPFGEIDGKYYLGAWLPEGD